MNTRSIDYYAALDPSRSVVVEACAGSGKTWLLASRIVRLLLAGVAPGDILAITFTRKAAREIEQRVVDWLRLLATADMEALQHFLAERGAATDADTCAVARGLYERVLAARPALAVSTFHGWFLQLVAAAPLSAKLTGTTLVDDGSRRFEEFWQTFARRLQRDPEGAAAQAFVRLLGDIGQSGTRTLLRQGLGRRAEWRAAGGDVDAAVGALQRLSGAGEVGEALAAFFTPGWEGDFAAYLGYLERSELASDLAAARKLREALTAEAAEDRLRLLATVLLTEKGELRARKPSKSLDKRFGESGAQHFLGLHAELGARLQAGRAAQLEERIVAFNRDALTVHAAFIAHVDNFKRERQQIDFIDAEWRVLEMLRDEANAAYVQARLDARYRHVLLDEFQDTSPLQWQILLAWLEAYTDAERPSVFLVGDPKQSIYRFRGAEPRLFDAAAEFLGTRFNAVRLAQDDTRRNAPAIVDVVNALFGELAAFQPFRPQGSLAGGLPGHVELLPLFGDEEVATAGKSDAEPMALRDPLNSPQVDLADRRREEEAATMAARLTAMIGKVAIRDGAAERPLRSGDVLLLVRKRSDLAVYERALAAQGIPFVGAARGGLLERLEVRDLVALLEFLVTPAADLPLAHALKSPLFACSDSDLLQIAARTERGWYRRLQSLAAAEGSAAVRRAAGMLAGWLPLAAHLPAHDLLDRIFHEGEVLDRYRAAAPEACRAAVLANLEALLHLALDLDGGRYPSLARFINELRELRRAETDDAPDEGELALDDRVSGDGRVRILTIHGAKGLEAPLVWLLDAHASPAPERPWAVLVDWPPGAEQPEHFSFVGRKDERGKARQVLFAADAAAAEREELNLLYVALTRAKQMFMASGRVATRGELADSPYARLSGALARLGAPSFYGQALPALAASVETSSALAVVAAAPVTPAVGERRIPADAAARFGILLHAVLERRTEGRDEGAWWRMLGFTDAEFERVRPVAERLLAAPALRRFFDAGVYLRAWNELEIVDTAGNVCRIDRLIEFADTLWVLDYKASHADTPRMADYHAQVAAYCAAVAPIFPGKPVRGGLVFADLSLVETFP